MRRPEAIARITSYLPSGDPSLTTHSPQGIFSISNY